MQEPFTLERVLAWTAGRLLADGAPAYGALAPDDDLEPLHKLGTVYALPRHRHVLDWRIWPKLGP